MVRINEIRKGIKYVCITFQSITHLTYSIDSGISYVISSGRGYIRCAKISECKSGSEMKTIITRFEHLKDNDFILQFSRKSDR